MKPVVGDDVVQEWSKHRQCQGYHEYPEPSEFWYSATLSHQSLPGVWWSGLPGRSEASGWAAPIESGLVERHRG